MSVGLASSPSFGDISLNLQEGFSEGPWAKSGGIVTHYTGLWGGLQPRGVCKKRALVPPGGVIWTPPLGGFKNFCWVLLGNRH